MTALFKIVLIYLIRHAVGRSTTSNSETVLVHPTVSFETPDNVLQVRLKINGILENHVISLQVDLKRTRCSSSPISFPCDLQKQHLSLTLIPTEETLIALLPGVTYNSEYQMDVHSMTLAVTTQSMFFSTPHCDSPDSTFTVCDMNSFTEPPSTLAPDDSSKDNFYLAITVCGVLCVLIIIIFAVLVNQHANMKDLIQDSLIYLHNSERTIDAKTPPELLLLMDKRCSSINLDSTTDLCQDRVRSMSLNDLNQPPQTVSSFFKSLPLNAENTQSSPCLISIA